MIQKKNGSATKDSIGQFLSPENGLRGHMERKGIKPKDHMKDNMRDLKEAQFRMREIREEMNKPTKELYKLSQFRDVNSKLYEPSENNSRRRASFESHDFLPRGEADKRREELAKENKAARLEINAKLEEAKYYADRPITPRKAAVPRANEVASLSGPSNADFISRNKLKAITMQARKTDDCQSLGGKHEEYGRVPEYLEERKARWAEEQDDIRRRRPDPNCPPGMCLMPEEERVSTLEVLQQSKEEALNQLRKLPFVVETPTMRKKQEYLESKLREIEGALVIFSKPKVYIASDK
jgi:hypothetical protein